jgi:ribosome biogenesis protein SSF1/2
MANRRSKKKSHAKSSNGTAPGATSNSSAQRTPKSMVIRVGAGEVGPSVSQLVQDVRSMMEPDTAVRLKVS